MLSQKARYYTGRCSEQAATSCLESSLVNCPRAGVRTPAETCFIEGQREIPTYLTKKGTCN
jgi:hypothetical protein